MNKTTFKVPPHPGYIAPKLVLKKELVKKLREMWTDAKDLLRHPNLIQFGTDAPIDLNKMRSFSGGRCSIACKYFIAFIAKDGKSFPSGPDFDFYSYSRWALCRDWILTRWNNPSKELEIYDEEKEVKIAKEEGRIDENGYYIGQTPR